MSNEETALAVRQTSVIVPRTLAEVIDLAERLSKSSLLPDALKGKVPDVLMQIMAGQELGLYSMVSLRSFNIISGKPVMSADAMVAVVLGSGKAEYVRRIEATDERATYATKRRGEPEQRCTWTMEMAKKAALHQKDNWRTYARAQLSARAKAELMRDVYPDVLAGCFLPDEIHGVAIGMDPSPPPPRTEPDAVDAEFTDTTDSDEDHPDVVAINTMETVEALKAHATRIAALKLTGSAKERATTRYNNWMAWLKKKQTPTPPPASNGSSSAGPTTRGNSDGSSDASTAPDRTEPTA